MRKRLNIASLNDWHGLTEATLKAWAAAPVGIDVYSTNQERLVGRTVSHEWCPPHDLWAECELDKDATGSRCAVIGAVRPGLRHPAPIAVIMTDLTREQIATLTAQWQRERA